MSTSPTRSAARWPPARARCSVVDASQGVEAQTLANVYQAVDAGHEIVPVLNKIDLPAAEPDRVKEQIEDVIGLDAADALLISAKTGLGIADVLEALVHRLPPPQGDDAAPLKALLVDSWYDPYLGVVILVRVKDGKLVAGQKIRLMASGASHSVERVGVFTPKGVAVPELAAGRDRLHHRRDQDRRRLPGRRHDHRGPPPGRRAAARLQAGTAGGVLRPVPDRCRRLRAAARQPRQAAPQRCELHLRAGDLGGAGLRLPLRVSRPPASRDHPGAALTRVRPRPDHHRALGRLPRAPAQRPDPRPAQPGRHARPGQDRPHRGALDQGDGAAFPTPISARSWRCAKSGAARSST